MSGAEVLTAAGEDYHLDRIILHGSPERGVESVRHHRILGIAISGAIHRHQRQIICHGIGYDVWLVGNRQWSQPSLSVLRHRSRLIRGWRASRA
jgi:hypothetical protein